MNAIKLVAAAPTEEAKLAAFNQLIARPPTSAVLKKLRALLYDPCAALRYEVAVFLRREEVPLHGEDHAQSLFALGLMEEFVAHPDARPLVLEALRDPQPRVRQKVLNVLNYSFCRTPYEQALYQYARADTPALCDIYLHGDDALKKYITDLLREGTRPEKNTPFLRRQYAACLEQLTGMENLDEAVVRLLHSPANRVKKGRRAAVTQRAQPVSDWELFLKELAGRGLYIDGERCFPKLCVGRVSGRVTYKQPGVQTWPESERLKRIQPPPGTRWWRFDFIATEPGMLLHFLLSHYLISLEDLPPGDFYRSLARGERADIKKAVNRRINGGADDGGVLWSPFGRRFLEALENLRTELVRAQRAGRPYRTLGGRPLVTPEKGANFGGRLMNRLIQGSASDFFNAAVLALHRRLEEMNAPARVGFLLFDEVWVSAPPERPHMPQLIRETLEEQNNVYRLLRPVRVKAK